MNPGAGFFVCDNGRVSFDVHDTVCGEMILANGRLFLNAKRRRRRTKRFNARASRFSFSTQSGVAAAQLNRRILV
jgi:hypothetical protein